MPKNNTCFIITPAGKPDSETREKADKVIDEIFKPVLASRNLELFVSHRHYEPENITYEIIQHLLYDDLVIANLTSVNPNVMYELGLRHATALPLVSVAEEGTDLPFDYKIERTISYDVRLKNKELFKDTLDKAVSHALNKSEDDNSITRVAKLEVIRNSPIEDASRLIADLFKDLFIMVEELPQVTYENIMANAIYSELDGYSFKTDLEISTKDFESALLDNNLVLEISVSTLRTSKVFYVFSNNPHFLLNEIKITANTFGIEISELKKIKGHDLPY